jgi:predicted KAP-like P-loop ATPase
MFSNEEKENVEDFMSYLDDFEEDRKKRIEAIKRIDKLLNNSNSFEETTSWKVEGKDEI